MIVEKETTRKFATRFISILSLKKWYYAEAADLGAAVEASRWLLEVGEVRC